MTTYRSKPLPVGPRIEIGTADEEGAWASPGDYVTWGRVVWFSDSVPEEDRPGLSFNVWDAAAFEALYEEQA